MRRWAGAVGLKPGVTLSFVLGVTLGVVPCALPAHAATGAACPTAEVRREARQQALTAQALLLTVNVGAVETDVPAAAQAGTLRLKEALVQAIDADVVCHQGSDAELQRQLEQDLGVNRCVSTSAEKGGSNEDATAGASGED